MRKYQIAVVIAALLIAVPQFSPAQENSSDTYRQLKLFSDVFERVRADYVEEVTDKELIEYAIQGMLSTLDPHSSYLNADSFGDMRVQTKGEFGGLGIEVTMENGFVKVVSPIDDTPAYRAGVQPGDFIVALSVGGRQQRADGRNEFKAGGAATWHWTTESSYEETVRMMKEAPRPFTLMLARVPRRTIDGFLYPMPGAGCSSGASFIMRTVSS